MNLEFTEEEIAFRDEVRTFIKESYPERFRDRKGRFEFTKEEIQTWQGILDEKGWGAPAWPVEYGGTGWTPTQKFIFSEELARAECAPQLPFGLSMCAPVIYTFGNEEQKQRFLPGIKSGKEWWCQGYSEPGAGSDLAAVKTTAVREGDHYIVNGQKTWTTLGQHADWIFCLVRTNPEVKKQEGISFLLIDMKTPGIEVRPIITMEGSHEVNEVWLTDVKVPVENRIGEENKGWTYAKFLLAHERTGIAAVARSTKGIERLRNIASAEMRDGVPLIDTPSFARKLGQLEIDLETLKYSELRTVASVAQGKGPGPESSILKIKGTEIQQRITELVMEAVGAYGQIDAIRADDEGDNALDLGPAYARHAAARYANTRKTSIYGGSNEIQRNIIAKMILGL